MDENMVETWWEMRAPDLFETVVEETVENLNSICGPLLGYAFILGDVYDPTQISARYSIGQNQNDENLGDEEFLKIYSPDEWNLQSLDAFPRSEALLKDMLSEFEALHPKNEKSFVLDETEMAYAYNIYGIIDESLAEAIVATCREIVFKTLWISQTFNKEILLRSIKRHNEPVLYERMKGFM